MKTVPRMVFASECIKQIFIIATKMFTQSLLNLRKWQE